MQKPNRRQIYTITATVIAGGLLWFSVGGGAGDTWEKFKSYIPGLVRESSPVAFDSSAAAAEGESKLSSAVIVDETGSETSLVLSNPGIAALEESVTETNPVTNPPSQPNNNDASDNSSTVNQNLESQTSATTQNSDSGTPNDSIDNSNKDNSQVDSNEPGSDNTSQSPQTPQLSSRYSIPQTRNQDPDTVAPYISRISADINNQTLATTISATDNFGVTQYDIQFIAAAFVDDDPQTFCANQIEVEMSASSAETMTLSEFFTQYDETPCTWFSHNSNQSENNFSLSSALSTFSWIVRARARDSVGNTSGLAYSGLVEPDDEDEIYYRVVISEIAWMGTNSSANDEWLEIFNATTETVSLDGWKLVWDNTEIDLSGHRLAPFAPLLLERTDDTAIIDITADIVYTGSLNNSGEHVKLINANGEIVDQINASAGWPAGDNQTKETMSRVDYFTTGNNPNNWCAFLSCPTDGLLYGEQNGQDADGEPLYASAARPWLD